MATNCTYSSLFSDVQNYLERGGSASTDTIVYDQIPRFINAAERKIMQYLKLQGEVEPLFDATGLTKGLAVISKPDRWRETISLNYGSGIGQNTRTQLYPRSYEYCTMYWPNRTLTSPPKFYADYDLLHWLISPTPDQNYPLEIMAYLQPILLDEGNQQNFFTIWTPNLLLYTSLMEASPFLKDDPRIATWQNWMQTEMQSLSSQDLQKILDRGAQRERP